MTRRVESFTVTGRGRFPLDMLRYDACWPAQSADALVVERTLTDRHDGAASTVRLTMAPGYGGGHPTVERWRSFGWQVVEQSPAVRRA